MHDIERLRWRQGLCASRLSSRFPCSPGKRAPIRAGSLRWSQFSWRLFKSCCSWFWVVAILGWTHGYTQRLAQRRRDNTLVTAPEVARFPFHQAKR